MSVCLSVCRLHGRHVDRAVGNGGLSLRSVDKMLHIARHSQRNPHPEDVFFVEGLAAMQPPMSASLPSASFPIPTLCPSTSSGTGLDRPLHRRPCACVEQHVDSGGGAARRMERTWGWHGLLGRFRVCVGSLTCRRRSITKEKSVHNGAHTRPYKTYFTKTLRCLQKRGAPCGSMSRKSHGLLGVGR